MNKLECIISFINVVEAQSFARAATKQQISTAAISRHISQLEQFLGAQLLHRTTRRLTLTQMGSQYYQQTKKLLAEFELAEQTIQNSQQEAIGFLHVLSNRYFSEKFLFPRLNLFMTLNSKLQIKLEVAERFPDLEIEGIDLIFGISLEGSPRLIRRQVSQTRYVLCASPDYLSQYGTPQTLNDLTQHRYITHSMRVPDNVLKFENHSDVYVNPVLWLNDSRAICNCALEGMGIARLHDYIVEEYLANKSLIEILPLYHQTPIPVFLYYQSSLYLQPKIRKFVDFFTKENAEI